MKQRTTKWNKTASPDIVYCWVSLFYRLCIATCTKLAVLLFTCSAHLQSASNLVTRSSHLEVIRTYPFFSNSFWSSAIIGATKRYLWSGELRGFAGTSPRGGDKCKRLLRVRRGGSYATVMVNAPYNIQAWRRRVISLWKMYIVLLRVLRAVYMGLNEDECTSGNPEVRRQDLSARRCSRRRFCPVCKRPDLQISNFNEILNLGLCFCEFGKKIIISVVNEKFVALFYSNKQKLMLNEF